MCEIDIFLFLVQFHQIERLTTSHTKCLLHSMSLPHWSLWTITLSWICGGEKKNIIESINLSNTSGTLCWKSIALVQSSHWSSGRSVDAIGVLSLLSSMGEDALLFLDAISLQPTASIINLLFWGVAKKHRFVCWTTKAWLLEISRNYR